MTGINNFNFKQNYELKTQLNNKNDNTKQANVQQQTQQAEIKAVKQPAVPALQQPTIKVPLENLQLNAGIIINNKGSQSPVASKLGLYIFDSQKEFDAKKGLMISGDYAAVKISDNKVLFYKVIEDGSIQECSKEEFREYKDSLFQNK